MDARDEIRTHPSGNATPDAAPHARSPYDPPTLVAYGSVVELTGTVGSVGKRDGPRTFRRTGF